MERKRRKKQIYFSLAQRIFILFRGYIWLSCDTDFQAHIFKEKRK